MALARYHGFPREPRHANRKAPIPEWCTTREGTQPRVNLYVLLSVRMQNPGDITMTRRVPVRRS